MAIARAAGRVFVLGLDAATFDVIDYLVGRGELPHLASIMAGGVRAPLESTIPPVTPPAWTTMTTGVNPGKHGVFDFFFKEEHGYRLIPNNAATVNAEPIWAILSRQGRRVCVYNVPFTYPPRPVNGVLISGPDTPGITKTFTYPASLKDELLARFPDYQIEVRRDRWVISHYQDARGWYQREIMGQMETQFRVIDFLLEREAWDFFMAVITAPDRLQHVYWDAVAAALRQPSLSPSDDAQAVFDCYRRIDEHIGRLRQRLGSETAFLIVSDHGFGTLEREVYLNQVFQQAGLLAFERGALPVGRRLRRWTLAAARTHVPVVLKTWIKRRVALPRDPIEARVETSVRPIAWGQTQVLALGLWGGIWLNVRGRETAGTVAPEQYDAVCDQVSRLLLALRDPDDGRPLVDRVYRRGELYEGAMLHRMPDLVAVMRGWAYRPGFPRHAQGREVVGLPVRALGPLSGTGHHRPQGVLAMSHPWLRRGTTIAARLLDITPTVLYLMGLPIPQDMDGQVLTEGLAPEVLTAHPPAYEGSTQVGDVASQPAYSQEDQAVIEERLRGLGYLE